MPTDAPAFALPRDLTRSTEDDWRELGARVFVPARPDELAVRHALEGARTPHEAWERLIARGIVPVDWAHSPTRRFATSHRCPVASCPPFRWYGYNAADALGCDGCAGTHHALAAQPDSVRTAIAVASDVRAMTTAEALADELAARLRAFGTTVGPLRVWHAFDPQRVAVSPRRPWSVTRITQWNMLLRASLAGLADLRRVQAATAPLRTCVAWALRVDPNGPLPSMGPGDALAACAWALLRQRGVGLSAVLDACERLGDPPTRALASDPIYRALADRALAELPDPWEPLLDVYALGYVVASANPSGIVLAMPRLAKRDWRRPERS